MPLPILIVVGGLLSYGGVKLYQGLKRNKKQRKQLPANHTSTEIDISAANDIQKTFKQNAKRDFVIASASLSCSLVGTLYYPPLIIPSLLGMAYITRPIILKAYDSVFRKAKVDIAVIDVIALPGIVILGHYFVAAVAYWLYALSQKLLLQIESESISSLINVFGTQLSTVWIVKNGVEIEIPFEQLELNDIVVINAGETIPVDGTIVQGIALIDQHLLTGESQPAEKSIDDQVFASTIVLSGKINIQVKCAGEDTVAAKIGKILLSTTDFKTSTQSYGEEIADKAALPSLAIAGLATLTTGYGGALAILFAQPGENMRIIAPLSTLNFLRIASKQGILIKDGRALEIISQVDTVVFDKTGTLTQDQPHVGKIYPLQNYSEDEVLRYAAAAEYKQKHPIAKAILQKAQERELELPNIDDAHYEIGHGIKVRLSEQVISVGSLRFMENVQIPDEMQDIISTCHDFGYSLVMVAIDGQLIGAIELHATIRPEAKTVIHELKQRNIALYIISGDHEKPTQQLAKELDIDNYFANTLPENKANLIQQLIDEGRTVCFIGDGINDSIALKKAHVSISLTGASTIATDTAQIILLDASLKHLGQVFKLADDLDKNLDTNLITTIVPGLAIVGSVFFAHLGIIGGIVIFNIGLLAGVTNSMLPLLEHSKKPK